MEQHVIVNLGQGSWQKGLPNITVQLWEANSADPMQLVGSLPTAPGLALLYKQWQAYYQVLNTTLGLRDTRAVASLEIEDDDITHVSDLDFNILCQKLKQQFNAWLSVSSFAGIERQLRTYLSASNQVQIIIEADDPFLRRFPWHLWNFLEDYRQAEVAIGTLEYRREKISNYKKKLQVRVLSVLGDSTGIEVSRDRDLLQNLNDVTAIVLNEPSRSELDTCLWDEQGWDILFFAGHSSSQMNDRVGQIKINSAESLSIAQLKYGLRTAINNGLQLAIFNSCDGMGLARELADLHIPYLIVMREPVPDQVAQTFLMNFLRAFAAGIPFHLAMREARERLQGLESTFPCASWLPVLCQTPGLGSLTWQSLKNPTVQANGFSIKQRLLGVLSAGAIASFLVLAARAGGILEPHELRAYDQFIDLQPSRDLPERVLIVEATKEDVNTYGFPIPNDILAQAIEVVAAQNPRVIGLDIFRNRPAPNQTQPYAPNEDRLYDQFLSQQNLVATCSVVTESPGVPPPPNLPAAQLGFSNVLEDPYDEVVRRQLLFMTPDPADLCSTEFSLGIMTALHYLDKEGIQPETIDGNMHLGKAIFTPLKGNSGAYRGIDANGFQVLLNYGDLEAFSQRISLSELIERGLPTETLEDYGVLIGVSDEKSNDFLLTPESSRLREREYIPGVILQAHMLNHILSAALDDWRTINVYPDWVDTIWIVAWCLLGGGLGLMSHRASFYILTLGGAILGLYGLCFGIFVLGWWIPWIPAAIGLTLSSSGLWGFQEKFMNAVGKGSTENH